VLVDDIVSSGATIASAAQALDAAGMPPASCVAVHALFDEATRQGLLQQVGDLVTTDTVPGPTSRIEIAELIAAAL
jgi:ribose-phosphate pyrophosphokinase